MKKQFLNLSEKTAFVLGGSGLIGSAVVRKLNYLGCKVVNLDVKKPLFNIKNFHKFDYTKKDISKTYKKIVKIFGLPDIFINCSYPKTKDWVENSFTNIKISSLKKNIDNQLVSSSFLIREVAEVNKNKKKKCNIVMLGSIYGLVGQDQNIYKGTNTSENLTYSIVKGGITNLTRQMGSYYSRHGIRVNNVCPGGVFDSSISKKNKKYINLVKNYSKRSPMNRMASPDEIADPIIFLASDQSSYISGSSLVVDGGWTSI